MNNIHLITAITTRIVTCIIKFQNHPMEEYFNSVVALGKSLWVQQEAPILITHETHSRKIYNPKYKYRCWLYLCNLQAMHW